MWKAHVPTIRSTIIGGKIVRTGIRKKRRKSWLNMGKGILIPDPH